MRTIATLGTTKSGKPVYSNFNNPGHKLFSKQDHIDASVLHSKVCLTNISESEYDYHWEEGGKHLVQQSAMNQRSVG